VAQPDDPLHERDDEHVDAAEDRPRLGRRDIWRLIFATYRDTFPIVLVFVLALSLVTWLITELVFGRSAP
jgi:hypothetical protein